MSLPLWFGAAGPWGCPALSEHSVCPAAPGLLLPTRAAHQHKCGGTGVTLLMASAGERAGPGTLATTFWSSGRGLCARGREKLL